MNKKRFWGIFLAIIILPFSFLFVACQKLSETVDTYDFVGCTLEYESDDVFTADGKLVLKMADGTTKEIVLTNEMLESVPDLSTPGVKTVTYIYDGNKYSITITIKESEATNNKNIAKNKLMAELAKYLKSDKNVTAEVSLNSDFVAKMFGLESAGSDNLVKSNLPQDIDAVKLFLDVLINNSLNGNVNIENVLFDDDSQLSEALKSLKIKTIESKLSVSDILPSFVTIENVKEVYNSILNQIVFEDNVEYYSNLLYKTVCEYLNDMGINVNQNVKSTIKSVCVSFIKDIVNFDSTKTLLKQVVDFVDYDKFVNNILLTKDNSIYVNNIANFIFEKLGITEYNRQLSIKTDLNNLLNKLRSKDGIESLLNGKTKEDYYDLLVRKILLIKDDSHYVTKLSSFICSEMEINSVKGEILIDNFVSQIINNLRDGKEIDWKAEIENLTNILKDYSESNMVERIKYIKSSIDKNAIEDALFDMFFDDKFFIYVPIDDPTLGEYDMIMEKVNIFYETYDKSIKSLLHYIVYRDFDKFEVEYPTLITNMKNAYDDMCEVYDQLGYGLYERSNYIEELDLVNDIVTGKYKNLINNFMQLNLAKTIAKDVVECFKGNLTSTDVVVNVVGVLQNYVAENYEDIKMAVINFGNMFGYDITKYVEQFESGEDFTILQDFVASILSATDVEAKNREILAENYDTFYNNVIDLVGVFDTVLNRAPYETYELLIEKIDTINTLLKDNNIEQIAIVNNELGDYVYLSTIYIDFLNDFINPNISLKDKVKKYLPMAETVVKENIVEFIYFGILNKEIDYQWDYDNDEQVVIKSDEQCYLDVEEIVNQYYQDYINDTFVWTDLRADIENLVDIYAPKSTVIAKNIIAEIDWYVYKRAIANGVIDENLKAHILNDVKLITNKYLEAYKDEVSQIIASQLGNMLYINTEDGVNALNDWANKYVTYYLTGNVDFTIENIKTDLYDIINQHCSNEVNLATDIVYNLTGDLYEDVNMTIELVASSYKTEIIEYVTERLGIITEVVEYIEIYDYDNDCYYEDKIITNAKYYTALNLWVEGFVNDYLNKNLNLETKKNDLLSIFKLYDNGNFKLGAEIVESLTGNLEDDVNMILRKSIFKYKTDLVTNLAEVITTNVLCAEVGDDNYAKTYRFVSDSVDAYLDNNLQLDKVIKDFVKLIVDCDSLSVNAKVVYGAMLLPVLIDSNIIKDYNQFMDGLIDITQLTNGAITSIDYNQFVADMFTKEFYANLINIPENINTVYEFDNQGNLVKETLTFVLNVNYNALVVSLDADFEIKLTINY